MRLPRNWVQGVRFRASQKKGPEGPGEIIKRFGEDFGKSQNMHKSHAKPG